MSSLARVFMILTAFAINGSLNAETNAPDLRHNEENALSKSSEEGIAEIGTKSHCHIHLTPYGCESRTQCFWDNYQGRCRYRW